MYVAFGFVLLPAHLQAVVIQFDPAHIGETSHIREDTATLSTDTTNAADTPLLQQTEPAHLSTAPLPPTPLRAMTTLRLRLAANDRRVFLETINL